VRPEIEEVIQLIQRRDPKSLEKALELLQTTVFSFSMKVCGQRQDAEDTMQEVLLKSVPNLPKFDNPRALMVWLYKVAKSRCLMSRRRSKFAPKQALSLEELMPAQKELKRFSEKPAETPETALMQHENAKRLREAVQKLPPDYRVVLVLRDMEELSDDDVAEIMGLKPGTVRVRLHRARLFVRKELERQTARTMPWKAPSPSPSIHLRPGDGRCKAMFAELSDYLDNELDASLCAELEKHMDGCGPCRAFLKTLERTIHQLRAMPHDVPDPRAAAELRRALLTEYQGALAETNRSPRQVSRQE
jgi:RNA polymerase sigma-70 factor (ECF subfamily)